MNNHFLRQINLLFFVFLTTSFLQAQNVGIGTNTPAEKLHVVGNIRSTTLGGSGTVLVEADNNGTLSKKTYSGNPSDVLHGDGTWGAVTGSGSDSDWTRSGNILYPFQAASDSVIIGSSSAPFYPFDLAVYNGSASGTHIGLGSVEYITDELNLTTINNDFGPASNGIYELGQSGNRWDDVWSEHADVRQPTSGTASIYAENTTDGGYAYAAEAWGLYGNHNNGNYGYVGSTNYGVEGTNSSGAYGGLGSTDVGAYGDGQTGSSNKIGVYGHVGDGTSLSQDFKGVYGFSDNTNDFWGYGGWFSGEWRGIYAQNPTTSAGYAGYFSGDIYATGDVGGATKSFIIDHPGDPAHKVLRHTAVESDEALVIYRGKVKLNGSGKAKVKLPDYFTALTKEDKATVQLTPVGQPFNVGYEWSKDYNSFIAYGQPNKEVSWQVSADRDDPYIRKNRKPVVTKKDGTDKKGYKAGYYLHPNAYGQPSKKGYDYLWHHKNEKAKPLSHGKKIPQADKNDAYLKYQRKKETLKKRMKAAREAGDMETFNKLKRQLQKMNGKKGKTNKQD